MVDSPSPVTKQSSLTPATPCHLYFSLKIAQKVDEKNFHLWRQHVEAYINAHDLTDLVVCARVLPWFLDDDARRSGTLNLVYFYVPKRIKCYSRGFDPHYRVKFFLKF